MSTRPTAAALLLLASASAGAQGAASNCDSIRADIEVKLRAGGLRQYTLLVIDAQATTGGREIGRCDRGRQKIVYLQGPPSEVATPAVAAAASRPAPRRPDEPILTECRDGRVMMGGSCRK